MNYKYYEIFDTRSLEVTLGTGDPQILVQFYELFVNHTDSLIADISNDTGHDNGAILNLTHKLKSSGKSLGAVALTVCMQDLESAIHAGDDVRVANLVQEMSELWRKTRAIIREEIRRIRQ